MFRIFIFSLFFLLFSNIGFAQRSYGNRKMVKKDIFIPDFHRIEAYGDFTIILREDSVNTLQIVTDANHVKDIQVKSEGDKIVLKDLNKVKASSCQLYLHYNMLKSVELYGSVHLEEDLLCTFDTLTLNLNGSSTMNLHLEAKQIVVNQSTNSSLTLKGQSNHARYNLNQNSRLNTQEFECLNTYIELFDNSEAKVLANYNLVGYIKAYTKLDVFGKSKDISVDKEEHSFYKKH